MSLKLFAGMLLLGLGCRALSLLAPSRPRVLEEADFSGSPAPSPPQLAKVLVDVPLGIQGLTKIVQKVAQNTGLSLDSEDEGQNAVEFRLSKPTGRVLNLMFNREGDETIRVTLKSDSEENLGETKFSVRETDQAEVNALLEQTFSASGVAPRRLEDEINIDWNLLSEKLFEDPEVAEIWTIEKSDENKEATLSLKDEKSPKKLLLRFREKDKTGSILFDDSLPGKPTSGDLHRAVILFSKSNLAEKAIAQIKTKLGLYQKMHSESAAQVVSVETVSEFLQSLFPEHDVVELSSENPESKLLQVRVREARAEAHAEAQEEAKATDSVQHEEPERKLSGGLLGTHQGPLALGIVLITKESETWIQIEMKMFGRIHTFVSPSKGFENHKARIKAMVGDLMALKPPSLPSSSAVAAMVQKQMNSLCQSEFRVSLQPVAGADFGFSSQFKNEEKACLFARSDILLSFNLLPMSGLVDSVLVTVVNPYLQTESILQPDFQNPEQSISAFVLNLFAELNDAKFFAENPSSDDGPLTVQKAGEMLEAKRFKSEEGGIYGFENENGSVNIRIHETEEMISVEQIVRQATTSKEKFVTHSQQWWIPKNSKADERKRLSDLIDNVKNQLSDK